MGSHGRSAAQALQEPAAKVLSQLLLKQKFDSIETLRAQIAHDADDCRAYFAQLQ